jgi:hypothetical protein
MEFHYTPVAVGAGVWSDGRNIDDSARTGKQHIKSIAGAFCITSFGSSARRFVLALNTRNQ